MWFAVQLDESVPSLRHDDDRRSGFGIKSPKSTSRKKNWIWKIHLRPENCHLSVSPMETGRPMDDHRRRSLDIPVAGRGATPFYGDTVLLKRCRLGSIP